ncbi:TPA: helix-turn-helix transcriptional regulator [Kluyvera ascorbata]|uniref:Transcriptional regulator n=1 Tax=Kluyvera genomosp. 2 TaxID=2774054 RepID=A0A2T2XZY5_9ENTR|nr:MULTISPECIES: metalloregulator ArsR/SmtB family transcription factor [Enterobacteriaceae]HAT3919820.1 helix-turn-helix transcriptional regulator [Kluyvera ascorbata]PSR45873.1 transcriptional regulator [Kluyvera genomosp. 2]BBQ82634.1 transcriptional regulator [Klebsiella sp. WP3-W18-ESBL-02]BBR19666.1 transcriptional regulator [Klebsiella sp. WP3-S18-ESBL-05]HAT3944456.1 helix-turn-helix transcriptional regulator [Kluyvera ascorbata]
MTPNELLQSLAGEAAALLKAMSNPRRLLILCMLCDAPGTSAGDLAKACGLSPSATSQHLARMREERLVDCRREAQRLHYFIKNEAVQQIVATLKTLYCP